MANQKNRFQRTIYQKMEEKNISVHRSFGQRLISEIRANKLAMFSVIVLGIIIVAVILAPLAPYDPDRIDAGSKLLAPGKEHWFGTDNLGRDYFTRALYGGRVSLQVGVFSMLVSTVFGTLWGTISGYLGGVADLVMMRIVDILMSIPSFLLLIILNAFIAPGLVTMVFIISLFAWMGVARIARAETMTLKERDFVLASRSMGEKKLLIMLFHIVPNMIPTIIVSGSISIANAILTESSLSFLGFGVQLPMSSWGNMLQGAQAQILVRPYMAFFPGLLILLTVLSFNVLGDVFRKVFEAE